MIGDEFGGGELKGGAPARRVGRVLELMELATGACNVQECKVNFYLSNICCSNCMIITVLIVKFNFFKLL